MARAEAHWSPCRATQRAGEKRKTALIDIFKLYLEKGLGEC